MGVGVVRIGPLDGELAVVALVERGGPGARRGAWTAPGPRSWSAWRGSGTGASTSATGRLRRSDTFEELYRDVGLDADDPQRGGVGARSRPTRCATALAAGTPRPDDHVELQLPGDGLLSCRAEVEWRADGTPVRIVGVVRDVSGRCAGRPAPSASPT